MKVWLSILIAVVAVGAFLLLPNFQNDAYGTITIEIIDESGEVLKADSFDFEEEDTLLALIDTHYHVKTRSSTLGNILLEIDSLETDFQHSFIEIRLTGYETITRERWSEFKPTHVGVDSLPLIDGNTYHFIKSTVNGGN